MGMAVIMACGHRDGRAFCKLCDVVFRVVRLVSYIVTNMPDAGQRPDGNEQRAAPPGGPKPARRRHRSLLPLPCHSHPSALTSSSLSQRRSAYRRP